MNRSPVLRAPLVCLVALLLATSVPHANDIPQQLPFAQDWSDITLISADNDWTNVPGIVGYNGAGMTSVTGVDPQTVLAPGNLSPQVLANQTNVAITNGAVAEFHITDPVIALQGSGTARAPHIVLTVDTTGLFNIGVSYNLRDIDSTADNAISRVALQFRVGNSGNYTNVPAGYVADASTGAAASLVTPVNVVLPAEAANQPHVNIRIITTDAVGSDEWIGIDDIEVTGSPLAVPTNPTGVGTANPPTVAPGEATTLSVVVGLGQNPTSSGVTVTGDLSSIGGSAAQPFAFQTGLTFTFDATVAAGTTDGVKTLPITIADAEGRTGSTSISLNVVTPPPPITSVTISQVYGGGGNSGSTYTHDFIELFNKSALPVDVTGWTVQYASFTGSSWQTTLLTGTIQPGRYYLVREAQGSGGSVALPPPDAVGTIPMAAGAGKVALVASSLALTGSCPSGPPIVDFVGFGTANCFEGAAAAPAPSAVNAIHRAGAGAIDTDDNAADFTAAVPTPRNTTGVPPRGTGSANPAQVDSGDTSLLTVTATHGAFPASTTITVTGDLSAVGGSTAQPFFDNGTNGDALAGDLVYSYLATITGTSGSKTIVATVGDELGRSTQTSFAIVISPPPVAIHTIQGAGATSTYAGQLVTTTGIVTALRSSSFYIQTPDALVDADPNTSEGLLVFSGFPRPTGFAPGDLVRVTGTVTEFVPAGGAPITEITSPLVSVMSTGHALPSPALLLPSFTPPDAEPDFERFEGMRVRADITAATGTGSFRITDDDERAATSASNGDFFAVITGVPRPRREPGLEPGQTDYSGQCCVPRFDGNPERLRVDSDGQSGASRIEIVAGQTIAGLTGVLDFASGRHTIVPDPVAWTPAGRGDALAVPVANANEFTIASFNMQRFFDTSDDLAVDEIVLTPEAFERRLSKASLAIRNVLRTPDMLGVEEMENLATLQTLAARVNADAVSAGQPNPQYVAYLTEGNDVGGIDVGFLVKSARVDVIGVTQVGAAATYTPPSGSPALLNDRPPLVLEAAIRAEGATPYPVTVIVNHLRSLNGVEDADGRVRAKRRAQAEFLANYIQARQTANPTERIISIGDYNAFQFNDGYVDLIGTIKGEPTPPNQVAAASDDLVNPDLTNLGDALGDDQYSYVFDGNAQAIDHILVNEAARRRFSRMAYARSNADFPESLRSDGTRPERLSDHDMPVAYFTLPGAPVLTLNGAATVTVEAMSPFTDPGAMATDDELGALPVTVTGSVDTTTVGSYVLTYSATNGFRTTTLTRTVNVVDTTAPVISVLGASPFTLEAGAVWIDPGATANDSRAGDLTSAIQVSGVVNTSVVGSYSVTYTVSDGYNSATATRVVNVVDTTAPTLSEVSATPGLIAVPNHKMIDVLLAYTTTDVTGTPTCSVHVTSNEPINGPGDGHTTVDWQVVNDRHVRVRAERSGLGDGRIYAIAVTCGDASGNSVTRSATVIVAK